MPVFSVGEQGDLLMVFSISQTDTNGTVKRTGFCNITESFYLYYCLDNLHLGAKH